MTDLDNEKMGYSFYSIDLKFLVEIELPIYLSYATKVDEEKKKTRETPRTFTDTKLSQN